MNIANVDERFMMLAGVKPDEMCRWRGLVEDGCAFVEAHTVVKSPDEAQTKALELLAAAYAYRLFEICNAGNLTSFTAGDVNITSSAQEGSAERLWQSLCGEYSGLMDIKGFIFGRIVI
ncbi:hypothetical protein [Ruminococcus sp.]|uniref:hypothetical protein n=1 Tax=Ruminococcus sp. TaxID=41978 RepID=UPI002E75A775|nr:hypothetical protein [Ruminococcus sp.]MEE1264087.1 hypothetical protein [Ruminococcus sp.]